MTRPYKLVEPTLEDNIIDNSTELIRKITLIEKAYDFMKKNPNKWFTINMIQDEVYPEGSRRHLEKVMIRLTKMNKVNKKLCVCECSNVFKLVGKNDK